MHFVRFWWRCFKRALRPSIEAADAAFLLVPALAGYVAYMLGYEIEINAPYWIIVLAVFGGLFLIRLFIVAPYEMWRDGYFSSVQRVKASSPKAEIHITAGEPRWHNRLNFNEHNAQLDSSGFLVSLTITNRSKDLSAICDVSFKYVGQNCRMNFRQAANTIDSFGRKYGVDDMGSRKAPEIMERSRTILDNPVEVLPQQSVHGTVTFMHPYIEQAAIEVTREALIARTLKYELTIKDRISGAERTFEIPGEVTIG